MKENVEPVKNDELGYRRLLRFLRKEKENEENGKNDHKKGDGNQSRGRKFFGGAV